MCANARAVFKAFEMQQMQTTTGIFKIWDNMLTAAMAFSEDSLTKSPPRFDKDAFDKTTWALVKSVLKPFVDIGCIEPRYTGKIITAYVFMPTKFEPKVVEQLAVRRAKVTAPARLSLVQNPPFVKPIEPEIRLVPTKIPRIKVEPSVAIIVDLANLTRNPTGDENGRQVLNPCRINWAQLRTKLSTSAKGKNLRIDRAVLCVSTEYAHKHCASLRNAEQHGFTVSKMFGDKEADPVVMSEIVRVVLDHLNVGHADRMPTLVLASGDKDFACMVETLRPFVKHEGLELSLRVVTWANKLSHQLGALANDIVYLDDIVKYIDPYGGELLAGGARLRRG